MPSLMYFVLYPFIQIPQQYTIIIYACTPSSGSPVIQYMHILAGHLQHVFILQVDNLLLGKVRKMCSNCLLN